MNDTNPAADPMRRLAAAMVRIDDALRDAMHAVHDLPVPETLPPGYWYARIGQLEAITARLRDLTAAAATDVRRLPAVRLFTADGSDVGDRVHAAGHHLARAARALNKTNLNVDDAWREISVVSGVPGPPPGEG